MTDDPLQSLLAQLETIRILLARPVVQRQLLAIALIIIVAWLLLELRRRATDGNSASHGWWQSISLLYLPLLYILFIFLATAVFTLLNWPAGLLNDSLTFFYILLIYRVILFGLTVWVGKATITPYQQRLFVPLLLWFVLQNLLNRFIDLNTLAQLEMLTLFNVPVTLGGLLTAVALFYIFIALAWAAQSGLQHSLARRTGADPGVVHAIVTTGRYTLIATGFLLMLNALGLDLSSFALIGGGLSVGIGFGLQQIVANFISGILLLFEQSLRPGDVIEINDQLGTVEKLNVRATVVRTNDNIEMIIPNEQFLTNSVTTYTKTSRLVRISINLGVGYDSDPHLVRQILLETAVRHELVEENPAPAVFFTAFGDSSLNFRLAVWTRQPRQIPRIRSDLFFLIWDTFQQHEITIPFPQHDLNLGRGWEPFLPPSQE